MKEKKKRERRAARGCNVKEAQRSRENGIQEDDRGPRLSVAAPRAKKRRRRRKTNKLKKEERDASKTIQHDTRVYLAGDAFGPAAAAAGFCGVLATAAPVVPGFTHTGTGFCGLATGGGDCCCCCCCWC